MNIKHVIKISTFATFKQPCSVHAYFCSALNDFSSKLVHETIFYS